MSANPHTPLPHRLLFFLSFFSLLTYFMGYKISLLSAAMSSSLESFFVVFSISTLIDGECEITRCQCESFCVSLLFRCCAFVMSSPRHHHPSPLSSLPSFRSFFFASLLLSSLLVVIVFFHSSSFSPSSFSVSPFTFSQNIPTTTSCQSVDTNHQEKKESKTREGGGGGGVVVEDGGSGRRFYVMERHDVPRVVPPDCSIPTLNSLFPSLHSPSPSPSSSSSSSSSSKEWLAATLPFPLYFDALCADAVGMKTLSSPSLSWSPLSLSSRLPQLLIYESDSPHFITFHDDRSMESLS